MSEINDHSSSNPLPSEGASCGLKPSKEAVEAGYEIDFSHAKEYLEKDKADLDDNLQIARNE